MQRFVRVLIVFAVLAGLAWFITHRSEPDTTDTNKSKPDTSSAVESTNPFYKAICQDTVKESETGTISDSNLSETSGITASHRADDRYWVHNDSGDTARIFAISGAGKTLGTFNLQGAEAQDWEDIASGSGPKAGTPYLYIADTGDNMLNRDDVTVYRLPEPNPDSGGADITDFDTLHFTYPKGKAYNVEALAVDPTTGKLYLISKSDKDDSYIFEAPANLGDGSTTKLTSAGTLSYEDGKKSYQEITAADISPDGSTIAVRTYQQLYVYDRPGGASIGQALEGTACTVPDYIEPQGEAVAFTRSGMGLVSVSEGQEQPVHAFLSH